MTDTHGAFSDKVSLDTVGVDLFRLMWSLRQTATHAFVPLGISLSQALTLFYIAQGCTNPKALANALSVNPTAVSALLTEFEVRGFVERFMDAKDKRRVEVRLTDLGSEAGNAARKAWQDAHISTLGNLSMGELQELSKLCLVLLGSKAS